MADLCTCGHEEREHSDDVVDGARDCDSGPWDDLIHPCMVGAADGDDRPECRCRFYTRSPLSAFRGPAVVMSREEAAGWLRALLSSVPSSACNDGPGASVWHAYFDVRDGRSVSALRRRARCMLRDWRTIERHEYPAHYAARCYLAARILRAVRP